MADKFLAQHEDGTVAFEDVPVTVGPTGPPGATGPVGPQGPPGVSAPVGYVGMPATVITEPSNEAVQAGVAAWLADRNGPFPKTRLVFGFSGTAKLTDPLLPSGTGQLQGVRVEGLAKRSTVLQWSDASQPLLTARGQLRNFSFSDFSVQSTVKDAAGFYFLSNAAANNQDGRFDRVEWMGSWDYGVGLNGDANANLDSEMSFDSVALSNDASFTRSWFLSGMTPGHQQEDQFLNYSFRNTKLEASHGNYLQLNYGGSVTIDGFNSWLHTGQSNGGVPAGTMIMLPPGPHNDSVCVLTANRVRAELRSASSKLIDAAWGGSGHVAFYGLDDTANSFKVGNVEAASYRSTVRVSYRDCALGGWHGVHGTNPSQVTYDNCHSKFGNAFKATGLTGNGQLRYDTASAPAVAAR